MVDLFRMTDTFIFTMPGKVLFGNRAAEQVGQEALATFSGLSKVLVVTDEGVLKAGLADPIMASLKKSDFDVVVFDQCQANAPMDVVRNCVVAAKKAKAEIILGLGGGSSMDTAKAAAVFLTNNGDMHQYMGMNQLKAPGIPLILIPTTAGTSSEISSAIVVSDDATGDKLSAFSPHLLARIAIIDPLLTLKMPPKLTAETGIDAFSHALEVFLNNIYSNTFSDGLALQAIELIGKHLRGAYFRGDKNLEDRYAVCMGCFTGMTACRPCGVGIVHGLGNPICVKYHVSHGGANALMMPAVMQFNLSTQPEKAAAVATAMGEDLSGLSKWEAARAGVEAVTRLITDIDLPARLRDVGVREEDFAELTQVVIKRSAHLIQRSPRFLNEDKIMQIYKMAW